MGGSLGRLEDLGRARGMWVTSGSDSVQGQPSRTAEFGLFGPSLGKVVETDGDTDVVWEADVNAQVDEPLLGRICEEHKECGERWVWGGGQQSPLDKL